MHIEQPFTLRGIEVGPISLLSAAVSDHLQSRDGDDFTIGAEKRAFRLEMSPGLASSYRRPLSCSQRPGSWNWSAAVADPPYLRCGLHASCLASVLCCLRGSPFFEE